MWKRLKNTHGGGSGLTIQSSQKINRKCPTIQEGKLRRWASRRLSAEQSKAVAIRQQEKHEGRLVLRGIDTDDSSFTGCITTWQGGDESARQRRSWLIAECNSAALISTASTCTADLHPAQQRESIMNHQYDMKPTMMINTKNKNRAQTTTVSTWIWRVEEGYLSHFCFRIVFLLCNCFFESLSIQSP